MEDLHEAVIKVIAGPEKKSKVVTPRERRLTAYHCLLYTSRCV